MKNCTKLHFTRELTDGTYQTLEDFFIGGHLLYENGKVKYTPSADDVLNPYILISDDMVFIDTVNLYTQDSKTYAAILPIYDAQSLKQNLECRCSIIRGELPYDIRLGIPLKTQLDEKRLAILNIINQTPGVESTKVKNISVVNKKFTMTVEIKSNFGDFVVSFS